MTRQYLDDMMVEIYHNNQEHGWFDADRSFGDDIALLHTEVSEMYEAFRVTGSTVDQTAMMPFGIQAKPEGVGSEAADVLIRLLDTCHRHSIDIEFEYERKMAFNRTRPHKHGKVM